MMRFGFNNFICINEFRRKEFTLKVKA